VPAGAPRGAPRDAARALRGAAPVPLERDQGDASRTLHAPGGCDRGVARRVMPAPQAAAAPRRTPRPLQRRAARALFYRHSYLAAR
jgi:hypothetical protein